MEEQLVSFETAALAKEKGFDIDCKLFYSTKDRPPMAYNISAKESLSDNPQYNKYMLAPTQSLLAKWLREVHNIEVLVSRIPPEAILASKTSGKSILKNYNCYVWNYNSNPRVLNNGTFQDVYEEALEIGLQEALKLIP